MKTKLVPTDVPDPNTGEPLYVYMSKPSRLWYWWRALVLYAGIVFRDFHGARIGPVTAWTVSRGVWDYPKDLRVWARGERIMGYERIKRTTD